MHPPIQPKNHINIFWRFVFIFFCSFINLHAFSQCTNSASSGGGTFANDNTISGSAFSPLANVIADDGSTATASHLISIFSSGKTNFLKATNFGFNIPASATICGVSVWIKKKATGAISIINKISDEDVRLVVGGSFTGNNAASGADWPGTAAFSAYGSATDTWGTTLTPAQVNSSNFGVAIAAAYYGLAGVFLTAEIDHIMMQISYDYTPVPLILGEFNTNISGNLVCNKWIMYEEEENAKMNLQRSDDGRNWNNIKSVTAHYRIGKTKYEFVDSLHEIGTYYYRLELVHASDRKTYSRINTINYKGESKIIVYPNPATHFLKIKNAPENTLVNVFTIDGQRKKVPANYKESFLELDIRPLNTGTYFIMVGEKRFNFIKY